MAGRALGTRLTDVRGGAWFAGIRPGTYSYALRADGYPGLESARALELLEGEEREVVLDLSAFDSSIAGVVKDEEGRTVPGIVVMARKVMGDAQAQELVRSGDEGLVVESGEAVEFAIHGLEAADYTLTTEATERYASARRVYRAGVDAAELVLKASASVRFHGHVRSRTGRPIRDARVRLVGSTASSTRSDVDGSYELLAQASAGTACIISAAAEGFAEGRLTVPVERLEDGQEVEVDITLDPLGAAGFIGGVVLDTAGQPVEGETVYVLSPSRSARLQTRTGADGTFRIGDVPVADDYKLWIYPRSAYGDFSHSPLLVTEAGAELEVVLEPLGRGALAGEMVDAKGAPLPGLTLWARSLKALGNSIAVAGDARGAFSLEDVPEGELALETRSLPRLSVRGARVERGGRTQVRLVLDWGELRLGGRIEDEAGAPVPGAQVALSWSHAEGDLESSSYRSSVADAEGRFEFANLGPGLHKVSINAAGFAPLQRGFEVGAETPEAVLQLQATPRSRR